MADEPLPGKLDRKVKQGDKRTWRHEFREDDEVTPIDMSGKSWLAQWRTATSTGAVDPDGTVLAVSTFDETDAADGDVLETLTATEASKLDVPVLPGRKYGVVWVDIQATDELDAEDVRTWLSGPVPVFPDVSHA